jgi:hypothetical protein
MPTTAISPAQLKELQRGVSTSLQALQATYVQCQDPTECLTLIGQSQQLAAQMTQLEQALFHQQTLDAEASLQDAFSAAQGLTAQLTALSAKLDKISDAIGAAAKLISLVAQIIAKL